jgi:uncharacterized protein (TIGR03067 family)
MRAYISCALLSLTGAAVLAQEPNPAGPLEGTWTITKGERQGKEQNKEDSEGEFRFRGASVKVASGAEDAQYRYEVRAAKKAGVLPEIDFRSGDGPQGVVLRGIYKLDGDDLVICVSLAPFARPTELATTKGTSVMMFTLKRKK